MRQNYSAEPPGLLQQISGELQAEFRKKKGLCSYQHPGHWWSRHPKEMPTPQQALFKILPSLHLQQFQSLFLHSIPRSAQTSKGDTLRTFAMWQNKIKGWNSNCSVSTAPLTPLCLLHRSLRNTSAPRTAWAVSFHFLMLFWAAGRERDQKLHVNQGMSRACKQGL